MSKFVNYNKRSVTLPPGCKNLIDLLQPHGQSTADSISPSGELPAVTRGESGSIRLAEIEKLVAMPFQSHAQGFIVMLSLVDGRFTFDFTQMQGELMSAFVIFEEDADRERLMQEFFIAHGLQLPRHDWTPTATQFIPGMPVQSIYHISPLPSDAATASKLTAELFRQVCGLNDDSMLTFRHYEMQVPPK